MKKLAILLLSLATIFSFMQCSKPSAEKLCKNANTRGEIISELMKDMYVQEVMDSMQLKHPDVVISKLMSRDTYSKQVMDSMQSKHPDIIISTSFAMMKSNDSIESKMMDNMIKLCKEDTLVCKMMMFKTMQMCKDSTLCKSDPGHPNHGMCMCNMCSMMKDKKEDHLKHHK